MHRGAGRSPEQEAYDIDAPGAEFRGEPVIAHSAGARADERLLARRDTTSPMSNDRNS